MEVVFWVSLAFVAYIYAGYPLLIGAIAALRPRPVRTGSIEPSVTLIVSAYNEERVIGDKLRNALELEYPADRLEVMVVSDACTDRTDEIVRSFIDPRVRLLRMPQRGGKTAGLNAAVAVARGEIIVFSDANAMYNAGAIRAVAAPFADPSVGCVTGEQRYHAAEAGSAGESEGLYWRYELMLKRCESAAGSLVGGDGAIYAIRRDLYEPMRPDDVSDFVNPLQIVMAGHRNVYQPEAYAMEHSGDSDRKEFRRKTRIVNQSWRAVVQHRRILNPLRHGLLSLQVWSHKVLRWWAAIPLIALAFASASLKTDGLVFEALFWAQAVAYSLAALGWFWPVRASRPRWVSVPYYFVLVNVASLRGIVENLFGRTYATWSTVRET